MMYDPKLTYCAAKRVGSGHWGVSGSIPSFSDETCDSLTVVLWLQAPTTKQKLKLHYAVNELIPRSEGGYGSRRKWLAEHGYITPYYRRANETPERTLRRKLRTYETRVRLGLPATAPRLPKFW